MSSPQAPARTSWTSVAAPVSARQYRALEGIRAAGGFGEPEQWRFEWQRHYGRDEWLDHLATTGQLTILPREQLDTVLNTVGAAIDSIGGDFTMHYVTLATAATLTP